MQSGISERYARCVSLQRFEIDPDIKKAVTPPNAFYTDPSFFEAAKDSVFARSWHFIGDSDSVRIPGQVSPTTLLEGFLDEPIVFTRTMDDQICCLSNVCTHRGNIVCEGPSNERFLRCRYHGRRFGLNGKFEFMPEFEGVEGFPSRADDLAKLDFAEWQKLLFISINPICTFEEYFSPILTRLSWLPVNEFVQRPDRAKDYLVRGHWALYCDNYLEGFHIPFIHNALAATLDYGNYTTELFRYGNLQLGVSKGGESTFDLPSDSPDFGKEIAAYYFWLFPNMMFNFYPWGLSINVVRPLSPDLTRVSFIPYVWKEELLGVGAGADIDRVEREDEAVVELVQKGLRSRKYNGGRYAPIREMGTHHFHRLLQEFLFEPQ